MVQSHPLRKSSSRSGARAAAIVESTALSTAGKSARASVIAARVVKADATVGAMAVAMVVIASPIGQVRRPRPLRRRLGARRPLQIPRSRQTVVMSLVVIAISVAVRHVTVMASVARAGPTRRHEGLARTAIAAPAAAKGMVAKADGMTAVRSVRIARRVTRARRHRRSAQRSIPIRPSRPSAL